MGIKASIYFTPVENCDNTFCQLYKICRFGTGKTHHMDVNLLNSILRECYSHMSRIDRLYFAARGNSQAYRHAKDVDLGGFSSRCAMAYTYPYPTDNFPTNMCKIYRMDSVGELECLMNLPDFWSREITKFHTIVSKNNIDEVESMLLVMDELRKKRTFLYTVGSIWRAPDLFVDEETILPLLASYQHEKIIDDHLMHCRKDGPNISVDYLGWAQLCLGEQDETAFQWTDFDDVYRKTLELFNNSEICTKCLMKDKVKWRYAIV